TSPLGISSLNDVQENKDQKAKYR
ncbi:hypothetical protein LCGC14_2038330, partial [marine sediment metagenome]